jgi:hypothetical protein
VAYIKVETLCFQSSEAVGALTALQHTAVQ